MACVKQPFIKKKSNNLLTMNKESLKELIKSHFNLVEATKEEVAVEEVKENFATVTLADGTEVSNNMEGDFEVGQEVYVKDEAGEFVTAPEGEHTSDSGIVLVVDAEGKLTGVHHPDQAGEGSLSEMSEESIAEDVIETAVEEGMSPSDVIETVKAVIEEVLAPEMEAMKEKMAEMDKAIKQYMSATPATESKTAHASFSKSTKFNKKTMKPAKNESRYNGLLNSLNK